MYFRQCKEQAFVYVDEEASKEEGERKGESEQVYERSR